MRLIKEETDKVNVSPKKFAEDCGFEIIYAPEDKEMSLSTMSVSRPGLLLSGFTEYFASSRIQVLGKSEMAYLAVCLLKSGQSVWRACFQKTSLA
jgi:serine kinase of HPr protein (carbohydrate metabolism regulator)